MVALAWESISIDIYHGSAVELGTSIDVTSIDNTSVLVLVSMVLVDATNAVWYQYRYY